MRTVRGGIPMCCAQHRLAALDHLDFLYAADAAATAAKLRRERDEGIQPWTEEAIADCLAHHREWLHGRLDDALDVGEVFWRTAATEGAE